MSYIVLWPKWLGQLFLFFFSPHKCAFFHSFPKPLHTPLFCLEKNLTLTAACLCVFHAIGSLPGSLFSSNTAPFESHNRHVLCQWCVGYSCPHNDHMTTWQDGQLTKWRMYIHLAPSHFDFNIHPQSDLANLLGGLKKDFEFNLCIGGLCFITFSA